MKNFLISLLLVGNSIIGFVVAFIKVFFVPDNKFDHSGLHTHNLGGKVKSVATEVKLSLHRWLSGLQHSPTLS